MMSKRLLYGIQQVGIGVTDIRAAERWYATVLEANIKVLEDSNPASDMAPYMGGQTKEKTAIILLNKNGGGGFELWQHTGRKPLIKTAPIISGDLGINYIVLHTSDLDLASAHLTRHSVAFIRKTDHLRFSDPFGNQIRVKEVKSNKQILFTGVKGCAIGVSDLATSSTFYQHLGYHESSHSRIEKDPKCETLTLASTTHCKGRMGGYFGDTELILIKRLDGPATKIYQDRYWGDPGFIHLCFDVYDLPLWVNFFKEEGFPFTVLSNINFKMGDAQGHWGYLEDPDQTLIEMVETHKIPIVKKIGLNIDLTKRSPLKPLPALLIKALSLKKVRL